MPTKRETKIGQSLRHAREATGISQAELGRMTGMSVGQISQLESGVRASPAFATVQRIATALHLRLDDLSPGAEPRSPAFPASARERLILRRELAALRTEMAGALRKIDALLARLDGEDSVRGVARGKR